MPEKPEKILIIRNDKLGDFCLALPTFALLKACLPQTQLHALVPAYTVPIAQACPFIDEVIIDPGTQADKPAMRALKDSLLQQRYPLALTLYSTTRIGLLLKTARIPLRIAPATKIAQIFYNCRVRQRRSQSLQPEYEYNLDLARVLLQRLGIDCDKTPAPPYLSFVDADITALRQQFLNDQHITQPYLIFIHPGSGGSANNLSPHQFAQLAHKLSQAERYCFVISAGPGEIEMAKQVSATLKELDSSIPHCIYESRDGLTRFAQHIAFANLFISGSTGPLHIAGALNRATVGFYPNRQSATPLRWQTLSQADRRLAFSPPPGADKENMSSVDLDAAATAIRQLLDRLYR